MVSMCSNEVDGQLYRKRKGILLVVSPAGKFGRYKIADCKSGRKAHSAVDSGRHMRFETLQTIFASLLIDDGGVHRR